MNLDDILEDENSQAEDDDQPNLTTDSQIFYAAIDTLEVIHTGFFSSLIPVSYGVLPESFKLPNVPGVTSEFKYEPSQNGADCKNQ